MAQIALLLGVKNGNRTIIDQGDPRVIRVKFKTAESGEGFDAWEVIESTVGRTRKKTWNKSEKETTEDFPKKRGRPSLQ